VLHSFAIAAQVLLLVAAPPAKKARKARAPKPAAAVVEKAKGPPPKLDLVELTVVAPETKSTKRVEKVIRVAHPADWTEDETDEMNEIRLLGPEGEGELRILAALHPSELGPHLEILRQTHPGAAPSPPQAIAIAGVDARRGERATRFQITGREVGEMVMIERGGVIVLFATIVAPNAWEKIGPIMQRCYPTVEVVEVGAQ
jgi:hypothetical protein